MLFRSGPSMCSNVCRVARCGNGERECAEDCDEGALNGQPGSGCTSACRRTTGQLHGRHDCLTVWTLDNPPNGAGNATQRCRDGAVCDFDGVAGQCTFHVGVCLNRAGVPDCTAGNLSTFELLHLDITDRARAVVAEALTNALHDLGPSVATIPDRCRAGVRGKSCSIPDDGECDTSFGADDGRCDVGTGVKFVPPLSLADQTAPCTPGTDVVVPAGSHMVLRSRVRQATGARDADTLRLFCDP